MKKLLVVSLSILASTYLFASNSNSSSDDDSYQHPNAEQASPTNPILNGKESANPTVYLGGTETNNDLFVPAAAPCPVCPVCPSP